ncbi:DUF1223 domain-containing protein [Vibrio sp. Of7-15]|uniref:DUF1223 domain-containing protein n=1 Tax=Vibrio sp. Of7-15 TaxID=2724879 RepID=UPI001EF2AC2C|nr:DUF1223 domain-containing protein [Vibrio sp. Of7-15]MCG7496442.1 DUF1223 domain-containing protein [Vibrio sp. Of7-15]
MLKLITLTLGLIPLGLHAQTWVHKGAPAQLVELYTSEGCSSCPPADKFLSTFKNNTNLWSGVIPMAFHVDYWDYLGWKDVFSHPSFSQRQRLYQAYGRTSSVYTPGFVVDGKEWRGFFNRSPLPPLSTRTSGALKLHYTDDGSFSLNYSEPGKYTAHLVLLSSNQETKVLRGENRGEKLQHDFVVRSKTQQTGSTSWRFEFSQLPKNVDAVAVWLTKNDFSAPIQTVAGWIEPKN